MEYPAGHSAASSAGGRTKFVVPLLNEAEEDDFLLSRPPATLSSMIELDSVVDDCSPSSSCLLAAE
jgi:hypothetical protein